MKPILKWVGGKTQIIELLLSEFPTNIQDYHEIFLGGGSVLFALLTYVKQGKINVNGKIYAYDLNESLINVYKNIQSNHELLYESLIKIIKQFNNITSESDSFRPNEILTLTEAKKSKDRYYYYIRNVYNQSKDYDSPEYSAMFIFLNKTCFRGIFRVGPNGFNVPYGNYKNPEIINKEHLDSIHLLIKDVIFECCDFKKSLKGIRNIHDFVYLDPPYVPEKATSFVGYTLNGFNKDKHTELFNILCENKFKFMMSNSDVKILKDTFNLPTYSIKTVSCKRSINSKNPDSHTNELFIKN